MAGTSSKRKVIYRECPWCGLEYARCFIRHLNEYHDKTQEDYVLKINNLSEVPKCARPDCTNKVPLDPMHYEFHDYCSSTCALLHHGELGTHWMQSWNREKNPDGSDVIMKGVVERGNCPFSSENRKYDEFGNDIMAKKAQETRDRFRLNPFLTENMTFDENGVSNINKAAMESKMKSGHFGANRDGDPNVKCVIYVGAFWKESKIKVGVTRNLDKRLACYSSAGIVFNDFISFDTTEDIAYQIENKISEKYNEYRSILDKDKYIPKYTYHTIGYTEWYDIKMTCDVIEYIKSELSSN